MRAGILFTHLATVFATLGCGSPSIPDPGGEGGSSSLSAGTSGGGATAGATGTPSGGAGSASGGGATAAGAGGSGAVGGSAPAGGSGGEMPLERDAIASVQLGTCAIGRQGKVACWGVYPDRPDVFLPPSGAFSSVVGGDFVCARAASGQLSCFKQPGILAPLEQVPTSPVTDFDIGVSVMCWLDEDGAVSCPQLEYPIPPGLKLRRVSLGRDFACGIRVEDAGITCWGNDGKNSAACGIIPETGQLEAPTGAFTDLDAGLNTTCALRTDGTVACWGAGEAADDPNEIFCNNPVNFGQAQPPSDRFTQISVGEAHVCGVKVDGSVACWGAGKQKTDCSLGVDYCGQSAPPAGTFVQVAAGRSHTCGMHADRTVECWGSNTGGRSTPPADFP